MSRGNKNLTPMHSSQINELIKKVLNLNNPNYIIFNDNLEILDFSDSTKRILKSYFPTKHLQEIFNLESINLLGKENLPFHIHSIDLKLKFRVKILSLERDFNILSFLPLVNSEFSITNYNLISSDIDQMSYLSEYVFLLETITGSIADYDRIHELLKKQNLELRKKNKEIREISRFPMENPSPVLRVNIKGEVLYENNSNFLNKYCTPNKSGLIEDKEFLDLLKKCSLPPSNFIDVVMQRQGSYLKVHISYSKIFRDFNVYITDITEYTSQLNKLRVFYEDILDNLPVDVTVFNKKREYIYLNKGAVTDDNLRSYLIGKTEEDYFNYRNLDYTEIKKKKKKIFKSIIEDKFEPEWVDKNIKHGKPKYKLRVLKALHNDQTNEIDKIVDTGVDITSRVVAQEKLLKNEKKWKNIIKNSRDLIILLNQKCEVLFITDSIFQILGFKVSSMLGRNFKEIVHPEDLLNPVETCKVESYRSETPRIIRLINKSGQYVTMRLSMAYREDILDTPCLIINGQDISAIKQLEAKRYAAANIAEENERRRISRDLHDGVGQYLATTSLYLHILENYAKSDLSEKGLDVFFKLKEMLSRAVDETRSVSHNIMPATIKDFGLVRSIEDLIENLEHANPQIIFFYKKSIANNFEGIGVAEELALNLFRSVQQIFNNALTHGKPSQINTKLKFSENIFEISIQDNGLGFDINSPKFKNGIGILSIKNRILNLGGEINFNSKIQEGTTVKFRLHFNELNLKIQ